MFAQDSNKELKQYFHTSFPISFGELISLTSVSFLKKVLLFTCFDFSSNKQRLRVVGVYSQEVTIRFNFKKVLASLNCFLTLVLPPF